MNRRDVFLNPNSLACCPAWYVNIMLRFINAWSGLGKMTTGHGRRNRFLPHASTIMSSGKQCPSDQIAI
jgi:hypothetical protein